MRNNNPSLINIRDDVIYYRGGSLDDWHMRIDDIALIVIEEDPGFRIENERYYISFYRSEIVGFFAPLSTAGMDDVLRHLAERLGALCLTNTETMCSNEYASRVLWPPVLAGQPLYQKKRSDVEKTVWQRVLRLGEHKPPFPAIDYEINPEIEVYLKSSAKRFIESRKPSGAQPPSDIHQPSTDAVEHNRQPDALKGTSPNTIAVHGDIVRYGGGYGDPWHVPISDIAIVAELAVHSFAEDYFLVLVTWDRDDFVAPMGTEGITELQLHFEERTGQLVLDNEKLSGSVDYDSNILWPAVLAGQNLYKKLDGPEIESFGHSMMRRGMHEALCSSTCYEYTPEVMSYLKVRRSYGT